MIEKLWTTEVILSGIGEDRKKETHLSDIHVCKLHCCWSVQFYYTTVHANMWYRNVGMKRRITIFLQSHSSPQEVRDMQKHTSSRTLCKESSQYSTGRKGSTRGSAGKGTRIIWCVMVFLMWNYVKWVYHRNQRNYEWSGKGKYEVFIQWFIIEEWKRNQMKLSSRRFKINEK